MASGTSTNNSIRKKQHSSMEKRLGREFNKLSADALMFSICSMMASYIFMAINIRLPSFIWIDLAWILQSFAMACVIIPIIISSHIHPIVLHITNPITRCEDPLDLLEQGLYQIVEEILISADH